jgi:hypothetical protein
LVAVATKEVVNVAANAEAATVNKAVVIAEVVQVAPEAVTNVVAEVVRVVQIARVAVARAVIVRVATDQADQERDNNYSRKIYR